MRDTVLFDVNETTLDLAPLRPAFERVFGSALALPEWFGRLLHASTVCAMTRVEATFAELAEAGLERSAALFGVTLDDDARRRLLRAFASLAPHADVRPALEALRAGGMRCAAFSNSSSALLEQQLRHAGLDGLFDAAISVEAAGTFKPDRRAYLHAAKAMDRRPEDCWMVAAHDWDVHGAMTAGLAGAYLARPATPYHPRLLRPTLASAHLAELVEGILASPRALA